MCLDRKALADLAAVTSGRYFRKRSKLPPPYEGGKPMESERMFGPVDRFERLIANLRNLEQCLDELTALARQLPDQPSDTDGNGTVHQLRHDEEGQ
jgi:hypothetical protein